MEIEQERVTMNVLGFVKNILPAREDVTADVPTNDTTDVLKPATVLVDRNTVRRANEILRRYQAGKKHLEQRLIDNEQFYKMRQWDSVNGKRKGAQQKDIHSTAWLFSCIESRYADMMDSYPAANVRPRQQDDKGEAQKLTAILPIINEQIDMESVYSDVARYALKHGTIAYSVLWDSSKHNGLGDIAVNRVDLLSLFWEPGVSDIQKSSNVFHLDVVSNDRLEAMYPHLKGELGGKPVLKAEYKYDENIDTTDKSVVVDWYYKAYTNGREVLHYCKYVNDIVLYATQNDPAFAQRGLYDHGKYPYVIEAIFPVEGSIAGYGYIDVGRDTQVQIDLLSKAIVENATMGASPRFFAASGTKVNEEEFLDWTKKIVHVNGGTVGEEDLRPIDNAGLNGNYINVLTQLVDQLKYTTANQDANNGVAPSGVTAASALAALQEVAGKNARAGNKTAYRAFKALTYFEIELIRQFYDAPRYFRITPDDASEAFEAYDNRGLKPQPIPGSDLLRSPEFDIEVTAEKANPYRKMEINELAMSFYGAGFFAPQNSDQAAACLSMMDFNGKREILQQVQRNGTLYQKLLQYQQIALELATKSGDTQAAELISQDIMSGGGGALLSSSGKQKVSMPEETPEGGSKDEHAGVKKARAQARQSTSAE